MKGRKKYIGSKEKKMPTLLLGPKVQTRNKRFKWAAEKTAFTRDNHRNKGKKYLEKKMRLLGNC